MKRLITATTLVLALYATVSAGDIPTSGSPAPAPNGFTQTTSPGEVPTVGVAEQITSEATSALLSVLGFLV
jgi:hypothetical protein